MDDKKRGLDDLLSDLGIGEDEAVPEAVMAEQTRVVQQPSAPAMGPQEAVGEFLAGLLFRLDPQHSVDIRSDGELLRAEVLGGDLGRFIGKEGKNLKAVEFLANVYLSKVHSGSMRVVLDAAGYRKRQEERIHRIAEDAALQAEVSAQPVELPPMRSGERRIIHLLLKQHPRVTTTSIGEGDQRRVVVMPRDQATGLPEDPDPA